MANLFIEYQSNYVFKPLLNISFRTASLNLLATGVHHFGFQEPLLLLLVSPFTFHLLQLFDFFRSGYARQHRLIDLLHILQVLE